MENEQEFAYQADDAEAVVDGQRPPSSQHEAQPAEDNQPVDLDINRDGNGLAGNDEEGQQRQSRRAPTFGGATSDPNNQQKPITPSDHGNLSSYAPRSHYSQDKHAPSKRFTSEYERTQQVLDNARARSREMIYRDPTSGNGYERSGGSPQRLSPARVKHATATGQSQSFVSKAEVTTQAQTYHYKEGNSRQHSASPFNETSINMRNTQTQVQDQSINIGDVSRSREFTGKENRSTVRASSHSQTREQPPAQAPPMVSSSQPAICNASHIHDSIINSYRRQIQNNSNLQNEYEALKIKIADVTQKRNMLEDSIRYLKGDYEKQLDQQARDIEVLQCDLENLKRANADLGQEGNAVNSDILDAKSMLNQREVEIQRTKTDLNRGGDETRFLKDNIEEARRHLSDNYTLKEQQHQKIYQLTAQLKKQETQNFTFTSESNAKTNDLNQLNDKLRKLDEQLHHTTMRFEDTSCKFDIARAEVARNQTENSCLQQDCDNANQRSSFLLETQRQLQRQKDGEGAKSHELNNDMGHTENRYMQLEAELTCIGRELEAVRTSNEGLLETGHCYKQELHALQNHADILALQNNDLQKELDEFVLTDDMIKNSLDRKGRVESIKQRVEDTLVASQMEVARSRSPRRQSRSPLGSTTSHNQQQNSS